jgi:hypothetical protein
MWRTSFDWRTPDAPAFLEAGPRVVKTDGIRLLGRTRPRGSGSSEEDYTFTNYDGFVVRTWRFASEAIRAGNAIPALEETRIHEERTDLAFGN